MYGSGPEPASGRRQVTLAVTFLVAALAVSYLPEATQERVASSLRASVLRPFMDTQELLVEMGTRQAEADTLRRLVDSLSAALSAQSGTQDENRTLRALLGLAERMGPSYAPATVLRPGTVGSQSMFFIDLGSDDGVRRGAPVLTHDGLVGRIREVQPGMSVGMDWTNPDFRASGMVEGELGYGIVENRPGTFREFREDDRLVLNGTPYNESFPVGSLVVTSGYGGIYPRGIPIGRIEGVDTVRAGWLKSYSLDPMVDPAGATHVLVMIGDPEQEAIERAWPADSLREAARAGGGGGTR